MKHLFTVLILFVSALMAAQEAKGSIVGTITDKEMNNDPLPFANVQIEGSTKGTTTDMDGLYEIANVDPGTYTLVISFVGYETLKVPNIKVEAGKVTELNTALGASSVSLDEVVVTTTVRRDSETALLLDQKKAIEIKESIGAQQLTKIGVSDAATATSKISGVTTSEASGDVFVRGLGDRYLSTTLNGLPIPSDDVERKNIDLGLFSTKVLENVGISKTYSTSGYADQASGNIDVTSRQLNGSEELSVGIRGGVNTNVMKDGVFNDFKVSPNNSDITVGFYDPSLSPDEAITGQGWDPVTASTPLDYRYALTAGKKFGDKFSILFTGSQSVSNNYREGVFKQFRSNNRDVDFTDATNWNKDYNTTALVDLTYFINKSHKLKAVSMFINRLQDQVFEAGRNGEGFVFEETAPVEGLGQFIRDQNTRQTQLWVNQLFGTHQLSDRNEFTWGGAYNIVNADEPNRIRNEFNIDPNDPTFVQFGRNGGFQQRKSTQKIDDAEYNGFLNDEFKVIDDENKSFRVNLGGNVRYKTRDFNSQFFGVTETSLNAVNPDSVDDLDDVFTDENFQNGRLRFQSLPEDLYEGTLGVYAGYANFNVALEKFNFNVGLRYEKDNIDVDYMVNNFPNGATSKEYSNIYPSLNFKYNFNEQHGLRFAASRTITLPEFKEIAPFEYVSPTGQITRGNPGIEASTNLNYDIKYEFFPNAGQLISLAGFYKVIDDPINKVQDRGAAGIFSFFNAGDQARVSGLELETRVDLISSPEPDSGYDLNLNLNVTRMWHQQDLKDVFDENGNFVRTFRYNNKSETGLQGASDWIVNTSLGFSTKTQNEFNATLTANYASDRIFALGAPEIQTQADIQYNEEIIEQGFVTLDAVISKDLGEHWNLRLIGRNLLNPDIERTQLVRPVATGIETNEVVRSYQNGVQVRLGISYTF
ncbi:TonB-dependent receptor [Galbibacter sp. BG1]|uniref:TonB-dependent receptor n=1 Tax=Galbibacter sp. BG1 TaxID=1170699 RepID=UPI0015BC3A9A|nr:TonB-dependent receptor [Galbibacter sp. BG1]QLE01543.1 TonB-dependent receptor [Galbibacter sp. BG1]